MRLSLGMMKNITQVGVSSRVNKEKRKKITNLSLIHGGSSAFSLMILPEFDFSFLPFISVKKNFQSQISDAISS